MNNNRMNKIDQIKSVSAELVAHEREVVRLTALLTSLVAAPNRPKKPSQPIEKPVEKVKPKRVIADDFRSKMRAHGKKMSKAAVEQAKENVSRVLNGKPMLISEIVDKVPNAHPTVKLALMSLRREGRAKSTRIKDSRHRMTDAWQSAA